MAAWPEFDYVIVGGGSAGCVLANRLSADPSVRVLLLEAGPPDRGWKIHMPAALTYNLMNDRVNWFYTTEPQAQMNGRRLYWPRGRVLGGSSSLNAMVYIRGHALDYDRWVEEGAAGWSYADVLPYFRRAETYSGGADAYRGDDGPLFVTRGATANPLFDAWIEAGEQAGYPATPDMNGYRQEGMGRMDMTVHAGPPLERRPGLSAAGAARRPNLFVHTGCLATRILLEGGRAVGVEYAEGALLKRAMAAREVILAGGAINSPQLLLLSGIGPADQLAAVGVRGGPRPAGSRAQPAGSPGVLFPGRVPRAGHAAGRDAAAQHGQDRPALVPVPRRPRPPARISRRAASSARGPGVRHPDIQFHFLPALVEDHGRSKGRMHAFQSHVGPMRPGQPRLAPAALGRPAPASADRAQLPGRGARPGGDARLRAADPRDLRASRRSTASAAASDPARRRGQRPMPSIDAFVRAKADSAYHP